MRKLTENDVEFILEAKQDDLQVRGNALASGNYAEDKRVEDEIIERLDNGDIWAWASVKVTARWKEFEGVDYLGGCSYYDEKDFKQAGGYWEDMKATALDDLNKNVAQVRKRLDLLEDK